ncbi:MAG: hypothetical protein H5T64_08325 [Chloroflexi bacterium]|nr:hypothetical protein [Chloroflexota bacterium]
MNTVAMLYKLQQLDLQITEGEQRQRDIEAQLGDNVELREARVAVSDCEAQLSVWRGRLKDLELELRGVEERIAKNEARLYGGHVTNPKELSSLEQDQASQKRRRSELEDNVLEAMSRVEELESSLATRREILRVIEARWTQSQAKLKGELAKVNAELESLRQERELLRRRIPADTLARYEELRRKKGGRAVAMLKGQMCEGCRVTVPSGTAQQAQRSSDLVLCENCGRILYWCG